MEPCFGLATVRSIKQHGELLLSLRPQRDLRLLLGQGVCFRRAPMGVPGGPFMDDSYPLQFSMWSGIR